MHQRTIQAYANGSYEIIRYLASLGVKFEKDDSGEYNVRKVHHMGTYLECFQINPLIKDYNGPACAYVTGPFGGYTANSKGQRFIECDYWSGQIMMEFWREMQSGNGPVFLTIDHLAEMREMLDGLNWQEGSITGAGQYVIERPFVEQ